MRSSPPRPGTVGVIVTAAGSGTRLGSSTPKALVDLAGQSLLQRALKAALVVEPDTVVVTAPPGQVELFAEHLQQTPLGENVTVVAGGHTRQESVRLGLQALANPQIVVVHDAARALAPPAVFERVVAAVREGAAAAIPAIAMVDTVVAIDPAPERVRANLPREDLRSVQTPQAFDALALRAAHLDPLLDSATDDASLVAAQGQQVRVVPGDVRAHKVTVATDLALLESYLPSPRQESGLPSAPPPQLRVGTGTDAHRFAAAVDPQRPLALAGLNFANEPALVGHSDGDVVAHACADALLSAAGLGDIGDHFGVGEPQWENVSGVDLLGHTVALVVREGFSVLNLSVQLIANRPRFAPRRAQAQEILSQAVGAPVSISATSTDELGFTGRGEGAAAVATALLWRPA